jgi:glycoprotein endo-alpha-1,2-mannosidase
VTVRGTPLDGIFIGLWLEAGHGGDLRQGGFDGFYTYFASTGFSFGSTLSQWGRMVAFAKAEVRGTCLYARSREGLAFG